MGVIEVGSSQTELTLRQRWSHYFAILFALGAILFGIRLRDSTLNATVLYINVEAGVRAFYPQNWLLDTTGSYVFRVRDMTQAGFKTSFQVVTRPVSAALTARNLLDDLNLNRSQTLAAYIVLSSESVTLRDIPAIAVTYSYVSSETNPFLQSVPIVVEGRDIIVTVGGQALIVTFLSDARTYDQNLPLFERFLSTLEF